MLLQSHKQLYIYVYILNEVVKFVVDCTVKVAHRDIVALKFVDDNPNKRSFTQHLSEATLLRLYNSNCLQILASTMLT
jgi:hypothetical protein